MRLQIAVQETISGIDPVEYKNTKQDQHSDADAPESCQAWKSQLLEVC